MKLPSVYTVILNWNQPEFTLDCLESLSASDYSNNTVVVVDNGSTDGSPQAIRSRFPTAVVIENGVNVGYSEGNNIGIEFALGQGADYIFMLNNDTLVDPQMLSSLVEVAESDGRTGIVGPTMYYFDPPEIVWGGENRINWRRARAVRSGMGEQVGYEDLKDQPPVEVDYIDTCAVLVKREVFSRVGLMSKNYFINYDDIDLNTRARKAGYRVLYVPAARMWHRVSAAMGVGSPAATYYMTRNSLLFFSSHAPGLWRVVAPAQIISRILRNIGAWTFKAQFQNEVFRRKRAASLLGLRDFFLQRYGKMGTDVAKVCYGK